MVRKASLIFKVQYEDEMEPKRRVEESSGWRGHEVREAGHVIIPSSVGCCVLNVTKSHWMVVSSETTGTLLHLSMGILSFFFHSFIFIYLALSCPRLPHATGS